MQQLWFINQPFSWERLWCGGIIMLEYENTLTCQDKNTNHKTPHKTRPAAYLTQNTYHHLTQHTVDHNANTLIWLNFYSAETRMQFYTAWRWA